jgi:hypothetical protein
MILMAGLGLILVAGVYLTLRWGATSYRTWDPAAGADGREEPDEPAGRPSLQNVVVRYGRGVAVALVAGVWTGLLVTGPAVRLIMRLLAVTGGDDAQGRITEADEIVGQIDLDGTIALILFGGVLPGLFSGAIYVVGRRWLPAGRLGGITFGALHLVVGATRLDPLRPDNPDFDLVGPGWLAVLAFGLAAVVHGMAIAAIADRYSRSFPPVAADAGTRVRAVAPLILPALLLIPGVFLLLPIAAGLVVALVASQIPPLVRAVRGRTALVAGRVVVGAAALLLLPGAVADVYDVVVREDEPAVAP